MSNLFWGILAIVVLVVWTATNHILRRLDRAAQERQQMMDAIAQLEAHVTWQTGFLEMSEGQRASLRQAVEEQVAYRKFS